MKLEFHSLVEAHGRCLCNSSNVSSLSQHVVCLDNHANLWNPHVEPVTIILHEGMTSLSRACRMIFTIIILCDINKIIKVQVMIQDIVSISSI